MAGPNVKPTKSKTGPLEAFRCWVDTHPRTGWYITAILLFNTLLNLLELLK